MIEAEKRQAGDFQLRTVKYWYKLLQDDGPRTPARWVTLEEVLRFLIYDLGMKPPCGKRWPTVIENSERMFREQYSTPH